MSLILDALNDLRQKSAAGVSVDGPVELHGAVDVQGSKNAALKIIPAIAAFPRVFRLRQVPIIIDTLELLSTLELLGATVRRGPEPGEFTVDSRKIHSRHLPAQLTRRTTAAFYFAGSLLGRTGSVQIGEPGGDEIGLRAIDLHLNGFRALGAHVTQRDGSLRISLPAGPPPDPVRVTLPSAGATVNVALAAASAAADVSIERAPDDADMTAFWQLLQQCGVSVRRHGTAVRCHPKPTAPLDGDQPVDVSCPPDRNDAFTWLAAGALSTQGIVLRRVDVAELKPAIDVLAVLGVLIDEAGDTDLRVRRPREGLSAPSSAVVAGPSPGFHSDWAPLLQLVLATAHGRSRTIDVLHSHRVRQAEVLRAMGADVTVSGGPPPPGIDVGFPTLTDDARYVIDLDGPASLRGVAVDVGNDVRACAATILAGTVARGRTSLLNAYALYRGYEDFPGRLAGLGAQASPLR